MHLQAVRVLSVLFFLILFWGGSTVVAQDPAPDPANDARLEKLKDSDKEVRIAALRELQTSLDPRIPEALLPLLSDEGNSIRRLAARGVGSRWHQIPEDRVPAFAAALKPLAADEEDHWDVANMARRARGLLTRNYKNDMFVPSPDGLWVIYERYGLPCLIDTERKNEELLGWGEEDSGGWFAPAWSNSEVSSAGHWEKDSRAVAIDVITSRRSSTFWFWTPKGSSLTKVHSDEVFTALEVDPDTILYPAGFFTSALGWKDDEFQFQAFFSLEPATPEGDYEEREAVVGWNLDTGKLRAIPEGEQLSPPENEDGP